MAYNCGSRLSKRSFLMKSLLASVLTLAALAGPAFAYKDKKLDEAALKAEDQLKKGKPEEAEKTLQKAATNLNTGEAYLALARLQQKAIGAEPAALSFAKAQELGPADPEILAEVALFTLDTGKARDAFAAAEAAVKAGRTGATLATLALTQVRVNDAATAVKTADEATRLEPTLALAHAARGTSLLATGQSEAAAAAYTKALEREPKLARARVGLAAALIASGKGTEAVSVARQATEDEPKNAEAFAVLGSALYTQNPTPANWSLGIAEAQQGAFLNPKSPMVKFLVGKLFEAQPNIEQAKQKYQEALEIDPSFAPARVALINMQVISGDLRGAVAEGNKLVQEVPGSGDAWFLLGTAAVRLNDCQKAQEALEQTVRLSPGNAEAHVYLGTCYHMNGKAKEAAAEYKQALDLRPNNLNWRTDYGLFLSRANQDEEAVAELRKVVSDPSYKNVAAWVNLGYAYRNMKPPKAEEAVKAYEKALELDPKEVQAALGLGWAYQYTKQWEQAVAAFQKVAQIDPKLAGDAYNGIAWSYYFKEDMAQARAFAAKAREAGRDPRTLMEAIDKYDKAVNDIEAKKKLLAEQRKQQEQAGGIESVLQNTRSKNPAIRMRAAKDLGTSGNPDAVQTLLWMMTRAEEEDWGVKQAAAAAFGNPAFGAAGQKAIPYLRAGSTLNCEAPLSATRQQIEDSLKCEDYRRICRETLAKIQK
jgi:tetratricopeptide (TPR) repeat protein